MDSTPEPNELRSLWAEDEGARRDIYVDNTSTRQWQDVLDAVVARWPSSYTEDGEPVPLPSASEILRRRSERSTRLEVRLAEHFNVVVYFFEDWQIEFTFNPDDLRDDADAYRILDFVLHVGRTLGRTVHMTTESHAGDRPPDDLYYDPRLDRLVSSPES